MKKKKKKRSLSTRVFHGKNHWIGHELGFIMMRGGARRLKHGSSLVSDPPNWQF